MDIINQDELMYKAKYLKYKEKYLRLKEQKGGSILNYLIYMPTIIYNNKEITYSDFEKYIYPFNFYKILEITYNTSKIIKFKMLNTDDINRINNTLLSINNILNTHFNNAENNIIYITIPANYSNHSDSVDILILQIIIKKQIKSSLFSFSTILIIKEIKFQLIKNISYESVNISLNDQFMSIKDKNIFLENFFKIKSIRKLHEQSVSQDTPIILYDSTNAKHKKIEYLRHIYYMYITNSFINDKNMTTNNIFEIIVNKITSPIHINFKIIDIVDITRTEDMTTDKYILSIYIINKYEEIINKHVGKDNRDIYDALEERKIYKLIITYTQSTELYIVYTLNLGGQHFILNLNQIIMKYHVLDEAQKKYIEDYLKSKSSDPDLSRIFVELVKK